MKQSDQYGRIIADAQRMVASCEMDLQECVRVAQRAVTLLDSGKVSYAMQMAGTLSGIAAQAMRRLEVAAATRRTADLLMDAERRKE